MVLVHNWCTEWGFKIIIGSYLPLTVKRTIKSQNQFEWSSWHTGHQTQSKQYLTTHLNRAWQDQSGAHTSTLFCLQGPRFNVNQPVFSTISRQCGGSLREWEEWGTCGCVANKRQRRRLRKCNCSMCVSVLIVLKLND